MFRTFLTCLVATVAVACAGTPATPGPSVQPTPSSAVPTFTPLPAPPTAQTTTSPSVIPTPAPTATATGTPTRAPDSPSPSPSASHVVSPPPSAYPAGSVIVTFAVRGEQYRILVIDQRNIAIAQKLLAGKPAPSIPNGVVVRGDPSVNTGWSWHIDPASLEFADVTAEVCDGKPSYVEDGTLTGDRFCPWSARVVDIVPANG